MFFFFLKSSVDNRVKIACFCDVKNEPKIKRVRSFSIFKVMKLMKFKWKTNKHLFITHTP